MGDKSQNTLLSSPGREIPGVSLRIATWSYTSPWNLAQVLETTAPCGCLRHSARLTPTPPLVMQSEPAVLRTDVQIHAPRQPSVDVTYTLYQVSDLWQQAAWGEQTKPTNHLGLQVSGRMWAPHVRLLITHHQEWLHARDKHIPTNSVVSGQMSLGKGGSLWKTLIKLLLCLTLNPRELSAMLTRCSPSDKTQGNACISFSGSCESVWCISTSTSELFYHLLNQSFIFGPQTLGASCCDYL